MRTRLLVLVPLVLGACADDDSTVSTGIGAEPPAADPGAVRYQANATVLEAGASGPQLCLGAVADSLPPQCGGPRIVGWDWGGVAGEASEGGTTWGSYHVVGTFADGVFTLTEAPGEPDPTLDQRPEIDLSSPCPEPEGGWAVTDPATATDEAQQAAAAYATAQPEFAGLWIDQSINPALADGIDPGDEELANDPAQYILNVRFTHSLDQHEAELRSRWGGALCVSPAAHTESELRAIQEGLSGGVGFLSSSVDIVGNHVELGVIFDDGSLQQRLDDEHGDGVVVVTSALTPVPAG